MDKNIATFIVSMPSVLVSIAILAIAYSQMRIASAKTKLDLYNKRFNVYVTALDYYQEIWNESHSKINEKSIELTKSYRESRFIFDLNDGIYEALGKIQQNGARIHAYKQHKYERENNLTNDRLDLSALHESSVNAGIDFGENLRILENQIEKYIQFKSITGWKFL
jgi:uncharacterized protein (DUF3084 family)